MFNRFTVSALCSLASLAGIFETGAFAQVLVSDKDDYQPGETAYLSGSGFAPSESIGVTLRVETPTDQVIDYAVGGIQADSMGEFLASWIVPVEALGAEIEATAIGQQSGSVANTHFTDSDVTVAASLVYFTASSNTLNAKVNISALTGGSNFQNLVVTAVIAQSCGEPCGISRIPLAKVSPNDFAGSIEACCDTGWTIQQLRVEGTHSGVPVRQHPFVAVTPLGNVAAHTASCAPCPTNAAPVVTCSDKDFGAIVGCLNGTGLCTDVSISAADFDCVASDPDGDPVTLTLLSASTQSLCGPGLAEVTVQILATDDPSARNSDPDCGDPCPVLEPMSTIVEAKVRARIVYAFEGCLPPLGANGVGLFKRGATLPIKFRLTDCSGNEICASALGALPELEILVASTLTPAIATNDLDSGLANDGDDAFRYSGDCGAGGQWIYNLSTKLDGFAVGVTYAARIRLDDGTTHDCYFSLRK